MFKRILSLVLSLAMVLAGVPMAFADEADTTPTEIQWLVDNGYVTGYPDGTLGLDKAITRAEVATIMVKAFDYLDTAKALENIVTFQDVYAQAKWANGYVNALAAKKIASGYLDGTFKPNNEITNAEVAAFMVKAIDGQEPQGPWPAAVVARANELGLFKGVENTVANAKATRQDTFMMIYNALMEMEIGNYSIVKGIVLENYRVESIDKDEIVVEIIRPIQKADYADESRLEEGDQLELTVPADVADVEELLGKVADFTINEKNEVVKVKVDDSYKYLQGEIEASRKKLEVDGDTYTVELDERYKDSDERIFRTYHNNKDYSYDDFYDEVKEAEFARVTVKNGKVLFIDAFDFDDIAPVAKVDDEVVYFDDTKDGELDELDEAEYVLVYEDGKLGVGSFEDIEANDVIHFYEDDNEDLTVVVSSIVVEGEYEEANAARAKAAEDLNIVVDDEEYPAVLEELRTPVYSTTMEDLDSFYALTENYDDELEPFADEEVVVLLDMFGNVQYIGAAKADNSFYAIVTNTSRARGEMKLLRADGEEEWYETDRNTEFTGDGIDEEDVQDEQFDAFEKTDFVKVLAKDGVITEIKRIELDPEAVTEIDKNIIDFSNKANPVAGKDFWYISKNAVLFVNYEKVMDIKTFLKDYYDPKDDKYKEDLHEILADVAVEAARDNTVARIIVVDTATAVKEEDTVKARIEKVRFRAGKYTLDVEYSINSEEKEGSHLVVDNVEKVSNDSFKVGGKLIEAGDIVTLTLNADKEITDIELVDLEPEREVGKYDYDTARGEYFVEFKSGTPKKIWISKDADVFGRIKAGEWVAYKFESAKHNIVDVIAVVDEPEDTTPTGVVTYINAEDNVIMIGDKAYEVANTAVLYDADGNLVAAGKTNVLAALTVNDEIEKFVEKDGVISSITAKTLQGKEAADKYAAAKKALEDAIAKAEKLVEDNKAVDATALKTAITTAKEILANEETTTKGFNDAVTTLETAIKEFEKKVVEAEKPTITVNVGENSTSVSIKFNDGRTISDIDSLTVSLLNKNGNVLSTNTLNELGFFLNGNEKGTQDPKFTKMITASNLEFYQNLLEDDTLAVGDLIEVPADGDFDAISTSFIYGNPAFDGMADKANLSSWDKGAVPAGIKDAIAKVVVTIDGVDFEVEVE